jgi:hypothetical protein
LNRLTRVATNVALFSLSIEIMFVKGSILDDAVKIGA